MTDTARREKSKLSSRHRILEAALTAFETVGYQAATIDDIAESAGLARRTVYHHFKTKQDILVAASTEQAHLFLQQMQTAVVPTDDFVSFFIDCICYVIEYAPASKFFMLQAAAGLAIDSAVVYFSNPALTGEWIRFFKDPFIAAKLSGQINPEVELMPLLNWFGRVCTSYLQFRSPKETLPVLRRQLQVFVESALRANTSVMAP